MSQQKSNFESIFNEGRKQYEKQTKQRLDPTFCSTLNTVSDLRKHIERENDKFATFRDRNNNIYDRLNTAFAPVERFGHILGAGSSAGFPPAGACLGAVAILIKSAHDVSAHYDRIVELLDMLAGIMDRLELHDLDHTSPQLENNFANVLATILELLGYSTKAITRKRWKEYMARLLQGEDQKLAQLHKRLERLVQDGTSLVIEQVNTRVTEIAGHTTRTVAKVEDIKVDTERIGADIGNMKDTSHAIMDLLQKQHHTKCDNDIYNLLRPAQPNTDKMEGIMRDRVAGTGGWLWSEPAFQSWLRRDHSLLWICGSPGCGKTYLASAIVSLIQSNIARSLNGWRSSAVGFFFLSKNDTHTRIGGFHQAFRDMAWQITRSHGSYADHVASQCRTGTDIETLPSAWRKLFVTYFGPASTNSLYLIIDGFDEAEDEGEYGRGEFLKLLSDLQGSSKLNISLLLLGRPHLTHCIKVATYNLASGMATIHIEAHKTKDDLSEFVSHGIARWLQLQGASDDLKRYIQSEIETRAKGMFLWAKLMLGILQWQTTEDDIRDSLRNAPEAIDDMITEMMKVYSSLLKGREADEFNTILAWVSCAIRPLTLAEVDAALRRLSPSASRVLALEQKCREKYASLIDLVRDDGLSTASLQSNYKPISINSIPETTRVVFAHASIAEYFKNDPGKFAKWKTATPVGIRRAEAQYNIFKTCLEIFVSPGEGAWREASRALQTYAKATWMKHIQILCSETDYARSESPSAYGGLLHLVYAFLKKESAVRLWCRDLPWQSYTEVSAVMIAKCIEIWAQYIPHESSSLLQQWVTDTKENPSIVFVQIARVNLHESLHGDWYPFQSLAVVAQIKALVEGDDTLDCAPNQGKLSMNVIASALAWITIEPNASWHRNVAICYRRSGHISKAIEHFQRALDLDPELVEARGGLAIAYQEQGYHTKAIDLELINAKILHKRIATAELRDQDDTRSRQELSTSYETIAHDYWMLQDKMQALKYWRRAVATGHIRDKTLRDYFTVLAGVQDESRWQEVLHVLRTLHESQDATGQNRLTKYIHRESWPYEEPPEFFYMAATAARETSCLSFLIEAYRAAIVSAASTSHLSVLILQLALVKLYKNYQYNFVEIEPLMDEIIQVVSIEHDPKIRELEDCKENLARDYCQMCIRKAIAACNAGRDNSQYTHKVEALFKSGVFPYDITAKVIFREKTHLYLALLERVTGSLEDAAHILRPYMQQCCSMRAESQTRNIAGLRYLAVSLLALGQIDDFLPLASFVFVTFGWRCDICGKRTSPPNKAVICQHCLDFICQRCLAERETGRVIRFCSPGHHVLAIEPSLFLDEGRMVLFRGSRKCVEDCVALVKQKWGLYEETSQS